MTATEFRCGSCGTELPPDSRFCNKCGAPITPAATSAEYKQVTVLFADVVRSMDIAATVGSERLREIMADLADRCAAVVQRYGGTVDKFTGDGIMAVFGAPVALEDHAVRACLAALGVQEEATEPGFALYEIHLLRLRALLAQAHTDSAAYAHFRDSYRDMARTLGFEGHIACAEAMP
jgi:class 3 adenylate cyclase